MDIMWCNYQISISIHNLSVMHFPFVCYQQLIIHDLFWIDVLHNSSLKITDLWDPLLEILHCRVKTMTFSHAMGLLESWEVALSKKTGCFQHCYNFCLPDGKQPLSNLAGQSHVTTAMPATFCPRVWLVDMFCLFCKRFLAFCFYFVSPPKAKATHTLWQVRSQIKWLNN